MLHTGTITCFGLSHQPDIFHVGSFYLQLNFFLLKEVRMFLKIKVVKIQCFSPVNFLASFF